MDDTSLQHEYRFRLRFDPETGISDAAFQEASGLNTNKETDVLEAGSENRFMHQSPEGIGRQNLKLSRGVVAADSHVAKWCQDALEGDLSQPIKPLRIELQLVAGDGRPLRNWVIEGAYLINWSVSDFHDNENEVALETVELAYTSVVRQ